jgi:hypothetical protein
VYTAIALIDKRVNNLMTGTPLAGKGLITVLNASAKTFVVC